MTDRHPSEPYGENTIERAFLDDVERAFDRDDTTVVVTCKQEHELADDEMRYVHLDVGHQSTGETVAVGGQEFPVEEATYTLSVSAPLDVRNGEDVRVSAFENSWIFEDVTVEDVTDDGAQVMTDYIHKVTG